MRKTVFYFPESARAEFDEVLREGGARIVESDPSNLTVTVWGAWPAWVRQLAGSSLATGLTCKQIEMLAEAIGLHRVSVGNYELSRVTAPACGTFEFCGKRFEVRERN